MNFQTNALRLAGLAALLSFGSLTASAELVANGDFQSGDLTDWATYVTPGGTNGAGEPTVTTFDLGSGPSDAAEFNVGGLSCCSPAGGGLSQTISAPGDGMYDFTAQIASLNDADGQNNGDAGTFSILVDGVTVASDAFGPFAFSHQQLDGSLDGSEFLTAGDHTLQIQVVRAAESGGDATPTEYFDNVSVVGSATPEPGTMGLIAAGIGLLAFVRNRAKRSA